MPENPQANDVTGVTADPSSPAMTAPFLPRGQSVRLAAKSLALGDRPAGALLAESRMGAADAFFSLKTYASAILAYYIALRIGLPRPYWSIVTCYIVAQPLAGAVFSKALFRMIGTIVGALVAIIIVPELVDAPELLSGALGLWLALCTYLAMLLIQSIDRLLPRIAALDDPQQRRLGVLALTSLRRNLASSAPPPVWPERRAIASSKG